MFFSTMPRIRSISFCWILWDLFNAARHRLPQWISCCKLKTNGESQIYPTKREQFFDSLNMRKFYLVNLFMKRKANPNLPLMGIPKSNKITISIFFNFKLFFKTIVFNNCFIFIYFPFLAERSNAVFLGSIPTCIYICSYNTKSFDTYIIKIPSINHICSLSLNFL